MPPKDISNINFVGNNCPNCERYKARIAQLEAVVSALENYLITVDTRNQIKYRHLNSSGSANVDLVSPGEGRVGITCANGIDSALQ